MAGPAAAARWRAGEASVGSSAAGGGTGAVAETTGGADWMVLGDGGTSAAGDGAEANGPAAAGGAARLLHDRWRPHRPRARRVHGRPRNLRHHAQYTVSNDGGYLAPTCEKLISEGYCVGKCWRYPEV